MFLTDFRMQKYTGGIILWVGIFLTVTLVIDGLTTYDDIQLFPELYDTTTIIERVTGEADLIKR